MVNVGHGETCQDLTAWLLALLVVDIVPHRLGGDFLRLVAFKLLLDDQRCTEVLWLDLSTAQEVVRAVEDIIVGIVDVHQNRWIAVRVFDVAHFVLQLEGLVVQRVAVVLNDFGLLLFVRAIPNIDVRVRSAILVGGRQVTSLIDVATDVD